jgi:hypothetical protein
MPGKLIPDPVADYFTAANSLLMSVTGIETATRNVPVTSTPAKLTAKLHLLSLLSSQEAEHL